MAATAKPMPLPGRVGRERAARQGNPTVATPAHGVHPILTGVVEATYTTANFGLGERAVAFVRRIGNAFYLVHNLRRAGKVKQLHLAPLGARPRITDDVVRSVSRNYPFLKLNWSRLREKVNDRGELFEGGSDYLQKLSHSILSLNLELADFAPPLLEVTQAPRSGRDLITQLRLLRSTVEVKLNQFDRARTHGLLPHRRFR